MREYRFGWLLDKINWTSLTFRPPYRQSMAFNSPTVLSNYYRRYKDVVKTKQDYIYVHDLFSCLQQFSFSGTRTATILLLLVEVCLGVFRKDVFDVLLNATSPRNVSKQKKSGIRGRCTGVRLQARHAGQYLQVATGIQRKSSPHTGIVCGVVGLEGDGNGGGGWDRRGRDSKLYRLI